MGPNGLHQNRGFAHPGVAHEAIHNRSARYQSAWRGEVESKLQFPAYWTPLHEIAYHLRILNLCASIRGSEYNSIRFVDYVSSTYVHHNV